MPPVKSKLLFHNFCLTGKIKKKKKIVAKQTNRKVGKMLECINCTQDNVK